MLAIYLWTRLKVLSLAGTLLFGAVFAAIDAVIEGREVLDASLAFLGLGVWKV